MMRDTVQPGANVLVVQTNNATFGYTAESAQQFAISRLRAMEHGRSVVHVSTVGQSALITPDGTAHQVTSLFTQAVVRGALPLRDATTLATRLGEAPEWVAAAALLRARLGVRGSARARVASRRRAPQTTKDEDDDDAAVSRSTRVAVLIPTYNERENLPGIVAPGARQRARRRRPRARRQLPGRHRRRSPTSSPPPTRRCTSLHRAGKEGLGKAYLAGFAWALDEGYDAIVEMDADGSHQPEQLPALLAALADADLVIGSRWVRGGEVRQLAGAPQGALGRRQPLHPGAARHAGQRRDRAATASTAASALRTMGLDGVASQGYCFQVDLTWRAVRAGLHRRRGADHLRRARDRRLQDGPATSSARR